MAALCHATVRKTFSLSLCEFFLKDSWCSNVTMFSWPNHRHIIEHIFLLRYKTCRHAQTFTCCCIAVMPTTSQEQLTTLMTERMELCWQDERQRTLLKQHVMKNETPFMAATPTTGGRTDAACIYIGWVSSKLLVLISKSMWANYSCQVLCR